MLCCVVCKRERQQRKSHCNKYNQSEYLLTFAGIVVYLREKRTHRLLCLPARLGLTRFVDIENAFILMTQWLNDEFSIRPKIETARGVKLDANVNKLHKSRPVT